MSACQKPPNSSNSAISRRVTMKMRPDYADAPSSLLTYTPFASVRTSPEMKATGTMIATGVSASPLKDYEDSSQQPGAGAAEIKIFSALSASDKQPKEKGTNTTRSPRPFTTNKNGILSQQSGMTTPRISSLELRMGTPLGLSTPPSRKCSLSSRQPEAIMSAGILNEPKTTKTRTAAVAGQSAWPSRDGAVSTEQLEPTETEIPPQTQEETFTSNIGRGQAGYYLYGSFAALIAVIVLLVAGSIYDTGIRIPNISLDRSKSIPNPRTFSALKQHNLDADLPLPYVVDQIAHAPMLRELGAVGKLNHLEHLSSSFANSIRSINQDSQYTCRSGEPSLCEKDLVRNLQNQIMEASRVGDVLLVVYHFLEPIYHKHHLDVAQAFLERPPLHPFKSALVKSQSLIDLNYKALFWKPYAQSIEKARIKKEEAECGTAALQRELARISEIKLRLDELAADVSRYLLQGVNFSTPEQMEK